MEPSKDAETASIDSSALSSVIVGQQKTDSDAADAKSTSEPEPSVSVNVSRHEKEEHLACGVFATECSLEFPKSVLQACGFWPAKEEELGSSGSSFHEKVKAWKRSLLAASGILLIAIGMMSLSLTVFAATRFAVLWLPNAVVIGFLCSEISWRTRLLLMPSYYIANVLAIVLKNKPWQLALAVSAVNQFECFAISTTTFLLVAAFSKRPGTAIDLTYGTHVACFGASLAWTAVRAVANAAILRSFYGPDQTVESSFGAEVVQWLDLASICLLAPFIISLVRKPPCLTRLVRAYPWRSLIYVIVLLLLACLPISLSVGMPKYSISATVIGLFISWPLISVAAPLTGVVGVTFCLVVVGFATLLYIPFVNYQTFALKLSVEQVRQDHLFWAQICIVVMVFSSLVFNVVLSLAERARADVEKQVSIRTKELCEARARAEEADRNKAAFIHFLCHELRNPLHAVSNLTEILIEEKAEAEKLRGFVPQRRPTIHTNLMERLATDRVIEAPGPTASSHDDPQSDPDPVHAIHLCTNYMLALLSDVLDVGRFENGAVKLETRNVDLHAVLEGVTAMARARAGAKGLDFKAEISSLVPKWVECDPLRLQQVINNLLSNSFKFTPTGGSVTLAVDLEPILPPDIPIGETIDPDKSFGSISLNSSYSFHDQQMHYDGSSFMAVPMTPIRSLTLVGSPPPKPTFRLRIRCTDSGIGIQQSALATLFDPWTQAPKTSSAEYGGSGLGLSISAQIVRLMGGDLKASSEAGKGAEFEFWVPLRAGVPALAAAETEKRKERLGARQVQGTVAKPLDVTPSSTSNATLIASKSPACLNESILDDLHLEPLPKFPKRRKVLVTDDSSINRRILVRLLSVALKKLYPKDDWIVEEAEDGMEAVEKVKADLEGSNEMELIYMDVVMPIMDGYSATMRIRNLLLGHPGRKIAVTVASANKVREDEWSAAGADGAISKPFGKKEMEEILEKYCGKAESE